MPEIKIEKGNEIIFDHLKKYLRDAIQRTAEAMPCGESAIDRFSSLKFEQVATLPYPQGITADCFKNFHKTNFIEFLNQLYTTAVSLRAIDFLKAKNLECHLCLGTSSGQDLSIPEKKIVAEIFAVTNSQSNGKLKKEIHSIINPKTNIDNPARYIFYMLPNAFFNGLNVKSRDKAIEAIETIKAIKAITEYNGDKYPPIEFKEYTCPNKGDVLQWSCLSGEKEIKIICFSQADIDNFIRGNNVQHKA